MEMVLRGAAIYVVVIVILRVSGRRSVAQLTPFDLVLLLILSETTQQALLADDYSITNAIAVMTTLFTLDVLLSFVKRRWPRFGHVVDGGATLLVHEGKPDRHALRRARLEMPDVLAAARAEQGILDPADIRYAILEADGRISIIRRTDKE